MNKYSQYIIDYMNNNTLYDYVKLFNNIYLTSSNIQYESNLALYQNYFQDYLHGPCRVLFSPSQICRL